MSRIAVVARFKAKPESADIVRNALRQLLEPTQQNDEGCIAYNLYQDSEDSTLFYFLEHWESKAHLDKHLESEHVQHCLKATEGRLEQLSVNVLGKIREPSEPTDAVELGAA